MVRVRPLNEVIRLINLEKCYIQSEFLQSEMEYELVEFGGQCGAVAVLFVQDGRDYMELGNIVEASVALFAQDKVEEMGVVLVLLSPGTSERRYSYYHPTGVNHESYQDYCLKELVPAVQENLWKQGKEIVKMGLLGDSLGATVSLAIAIRQPEIWDTLLLQSGVYPTSLQNELKTLQKQNWKIYQVVGLQEDNFHYGLSDEVFHILTHNRALREILSFSSVKLAYYEEDDGHLWTFWCRDLPRALNFFIYK